MSADQAEPLLPNFTDLAEASALAVRLGLENDPGAVAGRHSSMTLRRWSWITPLGGREVQQISPQRYTAAGLYKVMEPLAKDYPNAFLAWQELHFDLTDWQQRASFAAV